MLGEEAAHGVVVEFPPIVSLQGQPRQTKLRANVSVKHTKQRRDIKLVTDRKRPHIVSKIIQQDKIIFVTGVAVNGRPPNIRMNTLKREIRHCIGG